MEGYWGHVGVERRSRTPIAWESQTIEVDEIHDLGDDRILILYRWVTRGLDSGIELILEMAYIATVRDGQFVRQEFFADQGAARAAAEEGRARPARE